MTRLLVLRHGQSTWNAERRWQGWADAPLSPLGERQAHDAASHLAGAGLTVVCSSDLQRANRTAQIIAAQLGLGEVTVARDLRERDVGVFTGKTIDQIRVEYPHAVDGDGRVVVASIPGAETDESLLLRARPTLLDLAARFASGTPLIVSHGGVIRALERGLGAEPPPSTPNLAGRWFDVAGGELVPGPLYAPVEPELATTPSAE